MPRIVRVVSVFAVMLVLTFSLPVSKVGVSVVSAGGYCDWIQFVADVTIPDGLPVDPGFVFKKTWRLKNIGTCTWTKSYKLVFVGGTQMGGLAAMNLPRDVAPGQTLDLSLGLTAPTAPGVYSGYWQLQNALGSQFGMGPTANKPFFVEVEVVGKAPARYDFVANAAAATWRTEVRGKVNYPGLYGDPYGFVLPVDRPILENGIPAAGQGLVMAPPFEYNEHIYGVFPPYVVQRGDRFQAFIGCEYGSRECGVTFVLQYTDESGRTRSFWNMAKDYKNSFSRVNLSIGTLAGKKVSFILLIRPNGDTLGDHALWANPMIVNSAEPVPAVSTVTPLPVTAVPTVSTLPPNTGCDRAAFVSDVTVPDGTVFKPGETFTKTWRLRNNGKCAWSTDYAVVFSAGDSLGGAASLNLPAAVAPGQTIDLPLNLTAPSNAGSYRGYWFLRNPSGGLFGIGTLANKPFWLAIQVAGAPPPSSLNGYDFVEHLCDAQWTSGAGPLGCGELSQMNGSISLLTNPRLENNTVDPRPALLAVPQNIYNGYIQGQYPAFRVQSGDRFRALVNCQYGQRSCYVVFRLDYQIENGPVQTLWAFGERYEGLYYEADIDLSSLAGQDVKFILKTLANGSPTGDQAVWVAPGIVRAGTPFTPAPTSTAPVVTASGTPTPGLTATLTVPAVSPSATSTPEPSATSTVAPVADSGQKTFTSQRYDFQFRYPASAGVTVAQENLLHLNLPFQPGTTLVEKYLEVTVFENAADCTSPLARVAVPGSYQTQVITSLNGIPFTVESGQASAASQLYDWTAYSTLRGTACVSLNFVLHAVDPLQYPAPPPLYDKGLESALWLDIVSSFSGLTP